MRHQVIREDKFVPAADINADMSGTYAVHTSTTILNILKWIPLISSR